MKNKWLWYHNKLSKEEIERLVAYDPFDGLKILKGEMNASQNQT